MAIGWTLSALGNVGKAAPAIAAAYLWFTVVGGPRLMRDRQPLRVKPLMPFYNALQVVLNLTLFWRTIPILMDRRFNFVCPRSLSSLRILKDGGEQGDELFAQEILFVAHYQAALRLLDLIDTLFMVALKKNGNITFLHLYHHTTMALIPWPFIMMDDGPPFGLISAAVNNFVHCVMYTYYLLCLLGIPLARSWKKYVTQLQLLQFVLLEVHFLQAFLRKDCHSSTGLLVVCILQGIIFTALFLHFYSKAYKGKKSV